MNECVEHWHRLDVDYHLHVLLLLERGRDYLLRYFLEWFGLVSSLFLKSNLKVVDSAGLWVHSRLSGGLRLKNYHTVVGNHKFSSRFSFCFSFYYFVVDISSNLCVCEKPISRRQNVLFAGY